MAGLTPAVEDQFCVEFFCAAALHEDEVGPDIHGHPVPGREPVAGSYKLNAELLRAACLGVNGESDRFGEVLGDEGSPCVAASQDLVGFGAAFLLQGVLAFGLSGEEGVLYQETGGAEVVAVRFDLFRGGVVLGPSFDFGSVLFGRGSVLFHEISTKIVVVLGLFDGVEIEGGEILEPHFLDQLTDLFLVGGEIFIADPYDVVEDSAVGADDDFGPGVVVNFDSVTQIVEELERLFLGHVREYTQHLGFVGRLPREGGQNESDLLSVLNRFEHLGKVRTHADRAIGGEARMRGMGHPAETDNFR